MSSSHKSLQQFFTDYCETKNIATDDRGSKERCYVLNTKDCLLFMAETWVQDIRNAIDQTEKVTRDAKDAGDMSRIVMSYNWGAPDPGMDMLRIPVKLVESLDDKQAMIVLRCLEGIQKDIETGRKRIAGLEALFKDTANVQSSSNLEGERIYIITGKKTDADRRNYTERYAEVVATNALFNLPKALNSRLQKIVPKEARGRFFIEGRDISTPKLRYGAQVHVQLTLTDEGAEIYTEMTKKDPALKDAIGKLFRQAMLDPFGLSLKYYMGKHAVIKLAEKK